MFTCSRTNKNGGGVALYINDYLQHKFLYRQFLKKISVTCEERYKQYKNKLTGLLRYFEEKKHFTELLDKNKGNIKETWKIINCLINKKSKGTSYPTEFNSSAAKVTAR